ncbi:methyltransferase domain-containing protein [Amycolatopsis sp. K13G38]|uniref:Protein-L-isoaspartate O-methyltransferase n=1 Tax=Amycolatopsis acididurans TaxID=2724524 RepID=A0ABX1J9A3_9PSEU|nr:ATP-grasp peptide maturase system methyltransferase [Amycolatopsis acididurans]NKQ55070.1 methyltransferase domain-containing protein [Amycolatopsis acididurans]
MRSAARRRRRLVDSIRQAGAIADPAWAAAFAQVPRHVFVPRFFVAEAGGWAAVAHQDPGWLATVYSDRVLVTQLDGDPGLWHVARRDGPVRGVPTCSSSMPSIMAIMLEELLVEDGNRVLEVGTGTGYNAALLCHRLGSANVSTVDIDDGLVRKARARLRSCDYHPACATCDGERGFPAHAPYDRVLCTCAVSRIPAAWLEQTVPGGFIVTTLNRPIGAGLVRVTVGTDGTAHGRVLPRDGRFMPLRAHRLADAQTLLAARGPDGNGPRETTLSIQAVLNPSSRFEFFAGLALPQVAPVYDADATYLLHPDGSWARHEAGHVTQGGPRALWDLLEEAHADWRSLGEPTRERFGLTVTPRDQRLWLDDPDGEHSWELTQPAR